MSVQVLILAAGKGSRMKSDLPKVLHPLAGKPMLSHVMSACEPLSPISVRAIIGFGAQHIQSVFGDNLEYVVQVEQLGTGHAVDSARADIEDDATVLVLYGDVPLVQPETLSSVVAAADSGLALLSVEIDDPTGYGRIQRDTSGRVLGIVEHKDATTEEREIKEVNTGILAANGKLLKRWLSQLSNDNAAGEYYLTDIVAMAVAENIQVQAVQPEAYWEVSGVNSRQQLAELERIYQRAQADKLLVAGTTLADPARFDQRGTLRVGRDVHIDVNAIFEGDVVLGDRVKVGPNVLIRNTQVADDVVIHASSVIDGAEIGQGAEVGPFARLREGTKLGSETKIGNFVETKKVILGRGTKAGHLSYLGDAELGEGVNVGAGTITCNYDGTNKHKTRIGDSVFVGSNTSMVAPVEVESHVTIGAGSVITSDIERNALAIARARQRTIKNWKK